MVGALSDEASARPQYLDGMEHDRRNHNLAVGRFGDLVWNDGHAFPNRSRCCHAHTPPDANVLPVGGWSRNMGRHLDATDKLHDPVQCGTVNAGISVRLRPNL